jgi:hypothetical protein
MVQTSIRINKTMSIVDIDFASSTEEDGFHSIIVTKVGLVVNTLLSRQWIRRTSRRAAPGD